jgi:mRNA interferase RelE/StbE
MADVVITDAALAELAKVPRVIQVRITGIIERLEKWPEVSGATPLSGQLKGHFRVRTGDYRVVFVTSQDEQLVTIWKIEHRGGVYD